MNAPTLPGYDLARVFRTRDRIVANAGLHVGTVLLGDYYDDWLALVAEALPGVPFRSLQLSARGLLGRKLTAEGLFEFAWRLAGNVKTLKEGNGIAAWGMQLADEWMPLHVSASRSGRNRRDEPGHWLTFRVLAGSACPLAVRRFWTRAQSRFVAQDMGFNRNAKRPFIGAEHFVGMLLYGLFEPRLSEDKPGFHRVSVPDTMLTHNVALIAGRQKRPCPTYGFRHPCQACTVGYEACRFALHARTFVTGKCVSCGRDDATIDPDEPEHCVECRYKGGG
jgi:hypothetical protein